MICSACQTTYRPGSDQLGRVDSLLGLCDSCGTEPRAKAFGAAFLVGVVSGALAIEFLLLILLAKGIYAAVLPLVLAALLGLVVYVATLRSKPVYDETEEERKKRTRSEEFAGHMTGALAGMMIVLAAVAQAAYASDDVLVLMADIDEAVELAAEGDYERSTSAFALLLLMKSRPEDRVIDGVDSLMAICNAMVAALPYEELTEPVESMGSCPVETLEPWFADAGDTIPTLGEFGELEFDDRSYMSPGWVDFMLDVGPEGEILSSEMVYRTHDYYAKPAAEWLRTVRFDPGRFHGEPATYRSVRLRVEFVAD